MRRAASYLRWWFATLRCEHNDARFITGDEINYVPGYRRWQCRRCGRYLRDWTPPWSRPAARGGEPRR